MTTKEWIAAAAVVCVVLSGAYLVRSVYQASPQKTTSGMFRASASQSVDREIVRLPKQQVVATKLQVGAVTANTKNVQTRLQVVR